MKRLSTAILFFMFSLSCSGAEEGWLDLSGSSGAELFGEKCGMCHRQAGMGTGILGRRLPPEKAMLEDREDLTPAFVSAAVRTGIGVMFPLSRGEVSDPQLELIGRYLSKEGE